MNPLVSIIVPSYNQGRFLGETLDSIFAQDYQPLEVQVMDGASKDETVEVLKRYDGRPGYSWVSERDKGVVDAVNKGLARAKGEICGIQSSDDCYRPGAVTSAVRVFQSNAQLALVYADAEYIDAQSRLTGRTNVGEYSLENLLARRTFIMQSSAFFRTELARRLGGWRPEVSYVADNDLWLRLALTGPVARVEGLWSRYRFHEEQRDTQAERIIRDWDRVVAEFLPQLPPRLRRAARMGGYLTTQRYSDTDWRRQTRAVYAALWLDPRCVTWADFPRHLLLQPLWKALSWCKRNVFHLPARGPVASRSAEAHGNIA